MLGSATFDRYLTRLESNNRLLTSVTVEGELQFGVGRLPPGKRRERLGIALSNVLANLDAVVPISRAVAARYGRLKSELWASGHPMGENDMWIAATALDLGLILVTADAAFRQVPALDVDDWSQA